MKNKSFKSEIIIFALWTVAYFSLVTVANKISALIGVSSSANAVIEIAFMIAVMVFIKKKNMLSYYGFNSLKKLNYKKLFFLIPMLLLSVINLRYGIHIRFPWYEIILITVKALGIGFAEEILFRSFLFKSIMNKNTKAAVIISSIAFGLIHLTNLFTVQPVFMTLSQVVYATALGFMFTAFLYRTNNIIPCIICHGLIDASATFAPEGLSVGQLSVGWVLISILSLSYGIYLYVTKKSFVKS